MRVETSLVKKSIGNQCWEIKRKINQQGRQAQRSRPKTIEESAVVPPMSLSLGSSPQCDIQMTVPKHCWLRWQQRCHLWDSIRCSRCFSKLRKDLSLLLRCDYSKLKGKTRWWQEGIENSRGISLFAVFKNTFAWVLVNKKAAQRIVGLRKVPLVSEEGGHTLIRS